MKNFTKFFTFLAVLFMSSSIVNAQCTVYNTGPYIDINNLAPFNCDGSLAEVGFAAWTNEAYVIQALSTANTYTFSICNGYDENNWSALLAVVDAADESIVIAQNDTPGCEITFTVPADGDVIVIVADANDCGGTTQQNDNGMVAFGCEGEPVEPVTCATANAGMIAGSTEICFGDASDFALTEAAVPTEGEVFGHFWVITTEDISGSADPANEPSFLGTFGITNAPISSIVTPNNGEPTSVPVGTFYLTSVVFGNATADAEGNITFDANCTFASESFMFTFLADGEGDCEPVVTEGCTLYNTGPYTDINNATPSPFDCANGMVDLAFEAWSNESYIVQGLVTANTYTFSICNGYDENDWAALLAVVDATDPTIVIAQNDAPGCEITFDVPADGDVIIVVADANDCGGVTQQIDNGVVSFGCMGEPNPCPSISFDTVPCVDGEFTVEAVVSSLGDAPFVDITDGTTTQSVTAAGSVQFGPYAAGTVVNITANTGNAACNITSADLTDDCVGDPCTAFNTGPYTDISNATPSPLDCANGIVELAFQAWTNEAYFVQALPAGQPFIFSICNGYDANTWPAVLSVLDAVDQSIVIAQADGCQVSFTLDTPGDVIIVVANGNACGGNTEQIDNGFVGFGCDANACAANAGTLEEPLSTVFAEGDVLVVGAIDFQENPDYGYAYVMTDGAPDYNIVAISYDGQFELTAGGEFTIHGLSIALDDLPAIQDVSTGVEVLQLIDLGVCADLLVDESETFTITVIVGIDDNNNNAFLNINNIAPVPANNAVTVNFSSKYQNVTAQVTDLTGRIIDTYEVNTIVGNNILNLDINDYAAGVYMLNLRSAEATVNAKFIKQ